MANQSSQNTKIRALILLGTILVVIIGVIAYFVFRKPTVIEADQSRVARLPQITAVPGGTTSERYQQLQEEENKKRAEEAKKVGTSSVATIIGGTQGGLAGKETFGIEDQLLKGCRCPGEIDPAQAAKLIADIEKDPRKAAALFKANPGLAKALCRQKPELALKLAETDDEAAKAILRECPDIAKALIAKNPERFKQLLLKNPDLAKELAEKNPELFRLLAEKDPAALKELMLKNPALAKALAERDPDLVKKLILSDPKFANALAEANPDVVKDLMKNDSEFARKLAESNPALVKKLMRDDPTFARLMAKQNPDMVKKLMLDDPDFAKDMARDNPDMVKQLMKDDPAFAKLLKEKNPNIDDIIAGKGAGLSEAERARLKALEAELTRKQAIGPLTELQQKQLQNLIAAMDTQSKDVFKAWNEPHNQQFVAGEWASKQKEEEEKKRKAVVVKETPPSPAAIALKNETIKAGSILFAVLETSVNSDEPGPIMATIVGGKFKGAKLLGTMTTSTIPGGTFPDRVTLNFNLMNVPTAPTSFGIQAVAIDPDTARTALASDVDHHYIYRYGSVMAAAFMEGYAKVLTSQGTTTTSATNGQTVQTQSPNLNSRQQLFAALGQVGQALGQAWSSNQNRPYTITVESGTSLGILFLSDVNARS